MTQEEKDLLLKDLCARLPYKQYGHYCLGDNLDYGDVEMIINIDLEREKIITSDSFTGYSIDEFKPYLRPISSMTEEEKEDYNLKFEGRDFSWEIYYGSTDWFNEHHFDYRGLIKKGLALEAPENMYK